MHAIVTKLRSLKIKLSVVDSKLKINAPSGVLSKELLEEIKENKEELIAYISNVENKTEFASIKKTEEKDSYHLSSPQRGLYLIYEFNKDSVAYNIPRVLKLKGKLEQGKIQNVFNRLIQRHETLRTTFEITDGDIRQIIHPEVHLEIECYTSEADSLDTHIKQFIRPFDLTKAPIMRVGITSVSPTENYLMVDMHHIISDGISQNILIKDFVALYNEEVIPDLKFQYKDYSEWQHDISVSGEQSTHEDYWVDQFSDEIDLLELPIDFPRPPVKSFKGASVSFDVVSTEEFIKLKGIAEDRNATMFMVLLSVFNVFLSKISNQEDIIVGVPSAGRNHTDLDDIIGVFINVLPIRNFPLGSLSFKEFLDQVRTKTLECFNHQDYQYEQMIERLDIKRSASRNALYEVMFLYLNFDEQAIQLGDLEISPYNFENNVSQYDLTLEIFERQDGIDLKFNYSTQLFRPETIERFVAYFRKILNYVLKDPDLLISEMEVTSTEERNILAQFGETKVAYPQTESIVSLFDSMVGKNPDQVAINDGDRTVTFGELAIQADAFAHTLADHGLKKGEVVATLIDRSVEYIISILAILKNGGVYLPIDPEYPEDRIRFMLEDGKANMLLLKNGTHKKHFGLPEIVVQWQDPSVTSARGSFQNTPAKPNEAIYMLYTSGSEGKPKGVLARQLSLVNRLRWGWNTYPFQEGEVCCQKTSLSFVDHIAEIFSPLLNGVPLVIFKNEEILDVSVMAERMMEHGVSRITLVPSLLQSLIAIKKANTLNFDALKYVFCSGDILTSQLSKGFYAEFSHAKLINIYGSTEVSADITHHFVDRFDTQEVLKYFKHISGNEEFLDHLVPSESAGPAISHKFTAPEVGLQQLTSKFMQSEMAEPMTLNEYYGKLYKDVLPYTVNTASPTFIGHMTSVLPDYVHDLSKLISQINQNLVKIETSKSLTFLEREAIAQLHRLFYGHPDKFYEENIQKLNRNLGVITSGGSTANISALLSARNKVLFGDAYNGSNFQKSVYTAIKESGYEDLVVIGSKLMHYSFKKTLSIMGLGTDNIVYAANDSDGRINIQDLEEKVALCQKKNLLIIAIIGIAGSTERGSIDPLQDMADIAEKHGIYFHVDAAWGGALAFSDLHHDKLKGIEKADSITFCGHKQLFLPQGISVCLFKNPDQLNYNSITANYQATTNSFDFGRYTVEGSRSALSLCLHASLQILGKRGFELLIDNGIAKANRFADLIRSAEGFELISCHINIVNYRYIPLQYRSQKDHKLSESQLERVNQINKEIQEKQFYQGATFVSKTTIDNGQHENMVVFRAVLSNPLVTDEDLVTVLKDQIQIIEELYDEHNQITHEEVISDEIKKDRGLMMSEGEDRNGMSIGKPIHNVKVMILDKYQKLSPIGVTGEIFAAGDCLSLGYVNRPELQAKHFIKNPLNDSEVMFRMGDLGRWLPNGDIELKGRKDRQIKLRGFRIELGEIENKLSQYDTIQEVAVMVKYLDGAPILTAYYVSGAPCETSALKKYLSSEIPDYMIPTHYVFMERMPLNSSGKIDRKQLPDPMLGSNIKFEKPANELEEELAGIWAQMLNTQHDKVSANAGFLELGGHSLSATLLINTMKQRFGVEIPLNEIFEGKTIQEIAKHLQNIKELEEEVQLVNAKEMSL